MALRKVSELPSASSLTGTETLSLVQGGTTKRTTTQDIANLNSTGFAGTLGAVDNRIPRTNGTDAKTFQASDVELDDNNNVKVPAAVYANGLVAQNLETITGAGALDPAKTLSLLVTTGANALTLADGVSGALKIIVMQTDGGDGTLTPTSFANGTTITFNDANDCVGLVFAAAKWRLLWNTGATVA